MEKKYDVTALGELLIDFCGKTGGKVSRGKSVYFEACPGWSTM